MKQTHCSVCGRRIHGAVLMLVVWLISRVAERLA